MKISSPLALFLLAPLAGCGLLSCPAQAQSLNGQPVDLKALYPNVGTVFTDEGTQTVTPGGVTFSSSAAPSTRTTVTPTKVVLNFTLTSTFGTSTFNGIQLSEVGTSPQTITGVAIDPATNLAGFSANRVTFDSYDIFVNLEGLPFSTSNNVTLDVTSVNAVPEASSVISLGLLLALGAGGVMVTARKKRVA